MERTKRREEKKKRSRLLSCALVGGLCCAKSIVIRLPEARMGPHSRLPRNLSKTNRHTEMPFAEHPSVAGYDG